MGATSWRTCSCCGRLWFWEDDRGDLDFATSASPEETLSLLTGAGYGSINRGGERFGMIGTKVEATQIPGEFVRFVEKHGGKVAGVRGGEVLCAFRTQEDADEFADRAEGRAFELPEDAGMCHSCEARGGLCQHNFHDHQEKGAHSSRPHPDAAGAADPRTCPYCRNEDGEIVGVRAVAKEDQRRR